MQDAETAASEATTMALKRLAHRMAALFRPSRRLRFTRAGKWFFWITVGLGAAAVNSGNNMLYVMVSVQLTMILASGVLAESVMKRISLERAIPTHVTAGRPFLVELTLHNKKALIPCLALELIDVAEGPGTPRRRRKDRTKGPRAFVGRVAAGGSKTVRYSMVLPRRGSYRFYKTLVLTKFPFGFFETWKEFEGESVVVALPEPVLKEIGRAGRAVLEMESMGRLDLGRGDELYGLKEYRPGHDPRRIAHKASARFSRPIAMEMENTRARRIEIVLDNKVDAVPETEAGEWPEPGPKAYVLPCSKDILKAQASKAAGIAEQALGQGFVVSLAARGAWVGPGSGRGHLLRILSALAVLEPVTEGEDQEVKRADPGAERIYIA